LIFYDIHIPIQDGFQFLFEIHIIIKVFYRIELKTELNKNINIALIFEIITSNGTENE